MGSQSALGVGLIQFGLVVAVALVARHLLERHLSPDLVPAVLRHRVEVIDRLYAPLLCTAAAMLLSGLALYRLS